MFITNELTPAEIFAELIKGRRSSAEATKRFEALRHDKNLVPRFAEHIDSILDVYRAYRIDAHDIQSLRDDGVDVFLRFEQASEEHRVGLQIKSNDEFNQWANKKLGLIETLKAQYSAATANARVNDYYIVLCVDDVAHRKRVRMVCSELKNFPNCTIVEPRDALGFFDMSEQDLIIRTTRLLCNTDIILREALNEADSEEADDAFFLVSLVCHVFTRGSRISETICREFWSDWLKLAGDGAKSSKHMEDVIQKLSSDGVLVYNGGDYCIDPSLLPAPICALYFDLRVRNLAHDANVRDYIAGLLELRDRAISELVEHDDEVDDEDDDLC